MVDDKNIGKRIREARRHKSWSQSDLADALKYDQRVVSAIELGKRSVEAKELPIFADVLDVSILYFLNDNLTISDEDYVLIDQFRRLPNRETRQVAIDILKILTSLPSK